jgi:hypothetical protein
LRLITARLSDGADRLGNAKGKPVDRVETRARRLRRIIRPTFVYMIWFISNDLTLGKYRS